ncbi:RecB family exonuclease [Microlunatus ginsengisoli]|uniref:PD-(D/E)XK endonuclease-like domain-containing protein n=1 Tax=Microlunatus ginsengisoli TaxID=363863 RepID=A0ABP7AM30_9ACTN
MHTPPRDGDQPERPAEAARGGAGNPTGPGRTGDERRGDARRDPELDDPNLDLRTRLAILSARFAWDGQALAVGHEPTLRRLTDRTMSASTMHALEGCATRWAFEKLWPAAPDPFSPNILGNGAHTVLERFYGLPPADRSIGSAMTILRQVSAETFPGVDPLTGAVRDRWLAEVYAAFKGIFDIEDPARVDVAGRETEVRTDIAGVGFVGYVDRLDRDGDGDLVVVDYKTSSSLPKNIARWGDPHGDQQRLYLLALRQTLGEMPAAAHLHYTRLGQSKKVAQSKARLAETRDKFVLAAEKLALIGDTGILRPAPTPLCGWCPLVTVCPAARADGKVDRTDRAVPAEWLPIPVVRATLHPAPAPGDAVPDDGGPVAAAHGTTGGTEPARDPRGVPVTRLKEGQPYVEQADGDLNPNSYASMGAVDVVEMAVHALAYDGVPLTRSGVRALAGMYASIVLDVQKQVTGSSSWQDGMNSRARFLVKRVLRNLPTPLGAAAPEQWEEWAAQVTRRVLLMWEVAYGLWSDGPVDDPAGDVSAAVTAAKERLIRPGNGDRSAPLPAAPDGSAAVLPLKPRGSLPVDDHDGDTAAVADFGL